MAKRKKAQPKKQDAAGDAESSEDAFLQSCLAEIANEETRGITLRRKADSADPTEPAASAAGGEAAAGDQDGSAGLLSELAGLCTPEEMKILSESGAFGDVELQIRPGGEEPLLYRQGVTNQGPLPQYRAPPPPVPIYGEKPGAASSESLGQELRYLSTVMQPAETRWLVAELASDLLEQSPVTHTDISDAVIASIAPSTAQKVAFMADAQYKYTTAQFLQVYLKMRHVVLEHKIMLASARADAMLLAGSGRDYPPLRPEDRASPVSAVHALRDMIDREK